MNKALLEILACPACKSNLIFRQSHQELICVACRLAYPIRDEIPVMLVEQAREMPADEEAF